MGAFCCHGHQSFDPICLKTLCSLSPLPVMLHIKFDQEIFKLPASIKRTGSKTTKKRWRHHFPHYKSTGAFCCHGNQSFDPICPKTLCSISPTPLMLHIKFDQDKLTGFRDIQIRKCKFFVIQGQVTPK